RPRDVPDRDLVGGGVGALPARQLPRATTSPRGRRQVLGYATSDRRGAGLVGEVAGPIGEVTGSRRVSRRTSGGCPAGGSRRASVSSCRVLSSGRTIPHPWTRPGRC